MCLLIWKSKRVETWKMPGIWQFLREIISIRRQSLMLVGSGIVSLNKLVRYSCGRFIGMFINWAIFQKVLNIMIFITKRMEVNKLKVYNY